MRGHKLPYYDLDRRCRCTNCNKPIKKNVIQRKLLKPRYCYYCFLSIVKGLVAITRTPKATPSTTKTTPIKHLIAKNRRRWNFRG